MKNKLKLTALLLAVLMLLSCLASCESTGEPKTSDTEKASGTEPGSETEVPDVPADPVTLYVSPDGNDENDGSEGAPLASLDGARQRVREIKAKNVNTPVTVYFREGTYAITESVSFTKEDSGTAAAPVVYAAYENEKVTFSGALKIDPSLITEAEDAIKARVIDEEAGKKLMKIDMSTLSEYVIPQYCFANGSYSWGTDPYNIGAVDQANITERLGYLPATVYMGDTPLTVSRWPNTYFQTVRTPVSSEGKENDKTVTFGFNPQMKERASHWAHEVTDNLYMYGNLQYDFTGEVYRIDDINWDENELTIHGGGWYFSAYDTTVAGRYYFMNLPEEIDLPGESYTDYQNNAIYFYPDETFDKNNVCVNAMSDTLIVMDGAQNIVFDGIEISHTRMNAFKGSDVDGITVKNCTVAHVGNELVSLSGKNVVFQNCECYDASHGGLYIYGGDISTLESTQNVIENCRIHDCVGGNYHQFAINAGALGLKISHNEIYNFPATAIEIGSNDIVIEYNDIHDICLTVADAGAIYYWTSATCLGTTIRYNYFHGLGTNGGAAGTNFIYVDGVAPGCDIYGNLFVADNKGVPVKGNQYMNIHDNVFIDAYTAMFNGSIELDNPTIDYKSMNTTRAQIRYCLMYSKINQNGGAYGTSLVAAGADSDTWREHYKDTVWESYLDYWKEEDFKKYQAMDDTEFLHYIQDNGLGIPLSVWFDGNVLCNVNDIYGGNGNKMTAEEAGFASVEDIQKNEETGETIQCILGINTNVDKDVFKDCENGDYTFTDAGLAKIREVIPDFEALPLGEIGPQTK